MKLKRVLFFTQRIRYLFVIAVTLLPISSLMLLAFFTAYRPIANGMDAIVQRMFNEIQPYNALHVTLLKSVMPPNDYLIHGSEEERHHWRNLKTQVGHAFQTAFASTPMALERQQLLQMKERWINSSTQGDILLTARPPFRVDYELAEEMEKFDAGVYQLSMEIGELVNRIEDDIHQEYKRINNLKIRSVVFTVSAILLGMLMGIIGSIWLTREGKKIYSLSLHDSLTGIYNRRALEREWTNLEKHRMAYSPPYFSVLLIDLDKFKRINDRYGHDVGDIALKTMARLTSKMIRNKDIFGRYGGEEFLILLPETGMEDAKVLAERIRKEIESAQIGLPDGEEPIKMTVSIGCASNRGASDHVESIIKAADKALYQAKNEGRNRVVAYMPPSSIGNRNDA